jgi:hypothetical protein
MRTLAQLAHVGEIPPLVYSEESISSAEYIGAGKIRAHSNPAND